MKTSKAIRNAKKEAYAAKQEKEGRNVINWIFGILIALGVVYAIYSIVMVS
ncbi:MAG: hypothetical protein IJ897_03135 [Prevotella sp.]|nr:hypothetical protein [Prevotella sp.]MBR4602464.1 hypothetical protein [Prevotella sp.]